MTKLPYGFDPNEKPIDDKSDPDPLLDYIAQRFEDNEEVSPEVKRWFVRARRDEPARIIARRKAGRRDGVPRHIRLDAVERARSKMAARDPAWGGRSLSDWAIEQVIADLALNVTTKTVYGWATEYNEARSLLDETIAHESTEAAKALFQAFAAQGIDQAKALRAVTFYLHDNGLPIDDEELLMLREMAYGCAI